MGFVNFVKRAVVGVTTLRDLKIRANGKPVEFKIENGKYPSYILDQNGNVLYLEDEMSDDTKVIEYEYLLTLGQLKRRARGHGAIFNVVNNQQTYSLSTRGDVNLDETETMPDNTIVVSYQIIGRGGASPNKILSSSRQKEQALYQTHSQINDFYIIHKNRVLFL